MFKNLMVLRIIFPVMIVMIFLPVLAVAQEASVVAPQETSQALWYVIGYACVAFASSILSALVPMPSEGSPWAFVRKILDFLAVNVFNAKNQTK